MTGKLWFLAATLAGLSVGAAAAAPSATSKTCIGNREVKSKNLSAENGYFVRTSSGWWHNTVSCPAFAADRALITRSYNDRQCRGDLVEVYHPFSRINYGGCVLGAWEKVEGPPAAAKP
jgi:hypothetical protein